MKNLYILFMLFGLCYCTSDNKEIISPDQKIKVEINEIIDPDEDKQSELFFKILYRVDSQYREVLPNSKLGIMRANESFADLIFEKVSPAKEIHDQYVMIHGKRKNCENFGMEKIFTYKNSNDQLLNIEFRVYNNGVAFRYTFPVQSDSMVNIVNEATTYVLPDSTLRWTQPYSIAYEDFYPVTKTGISENKEWGYPAIIKVNDQPVWLLISEANIGRENCGTKLSNSDNPNVYKVTYPSTRDNYQQVGAVSKLPWSSPWHVLMIGGLSDIVESTLITDLSEPSKLKETDWIKPGPVSWIYWANNHGSKDYQKVVEYVDLAVEMGWPYVLIDWEWEQMTNGGNINDAVDYAKSKGIKPMIWYNSCSSWSTPTTNKNLLTAEKRAKEFEWLNEIGVSGVKVDFFAGDQQDIMQYYIDILEDAAKYKLMVNFHGATIPHGWTRTYPNLMTVEAVYGAEWYNNLPTLTNKAAEHNTMLPFTRNVIGPMDYTPVTISNSQHPHITSYGHELALSVAFESGLQHFADRPSAYYSLPDKAKEFLQNVPVSWDDTKLLDGYPGVKVVIARKKDDKWYIAGLNGKDEAQSFQLDLSFLGPGNYIMNIIKDGDNDKSFSYESLKVNNGDLYKVECLPRGGFVSTIE